MTVAVEPVDHRRVHAIGYSVFAWTATVTVEPPEVVILRFPAVPVIKARHGPDAISESDSAVARTTVYDDSAACWRWFGIGQSPIR